MQPEVLLSVNINPSDYYTNMWDPEGLSPLPAEDKRKLSKTVTQALKLVKKDNTFQARLELEKHNLKSLEAVMLAAALEVKDVLFRGRGEPGWGPKLAAHEELRTYLVKIKNEDVKIINKKVKRKMVVETPVAEDWAARNVDPTNAESVTNFYRETDSYLYELMAANHIMQTLYSFNVMLAKLKASEKVGRILDFGGGAGTLSILLGRTGHDVTYADLPSPTYKFADWRFQRRRLDIPMYDAENLDIVEMSPEVILCTEVFEHLPDPLAILERFRNGLRDDGLLIISESCEYTNQFCSHLESNRRYGGKAFQKIMAKHGFRQVMPKPYIPQLFFVKE